MSDESTVKVPKSVLFIVLAAIMFFVIGFFVGKAVTGPGGTIPTGGTTINPGDGTGEVKIDVKGEPALGNANAPVEIVEFTDYQCPFCERAFQQTYPQIKKDYIDTGKVRYVVKDFPLSIHPEADEASEAANCALDQGKYFEMHDLIFASQDQWAGSSDPKSIFKGYAQQLGLNAGTFNSCLDSGKYTAENQQDISEGLQAGVSGTPTFFINGNKLVGAQPYSAFQAAIDAELS